MYTVWGFYLPAFFKMNVNTDESLTNLNQLRDNDLAIYSHEYFHFLQDISTTFGLMNTCIMVDYIKFACHEVINNPNYVFRTPISPKTNSSSSIKANLKLKKIYLGDYVRLNDISIDSVYRLSQNVILQNRSLNVPYIKIQYKDLYNSLSDFSFGAYCVLESMAYFAESLIFPKTISIENIIYRSAELLTQKIYPKFAANKLNILYLCEASLGTYNPGLFFYDLLVRMESDKWIPDKPRDVYEYCINIKFKSNKVASMEELLINTSTETIRQLSDYFTSDVFKENTKWIEYTINTAVSLRCANPFFISDIVKGGHLLRNPSFVHLLQKLGTPMVTNSRNESTFNSPIQSKYDLYPQLFWVIYQIVKIFLGKQKRCDLKLFCQKNCKDKRIQDYTDSNCDFSPWEKSKIDPLCPFGQIWRMWGLTEKKPL